MDRFEWQPGHGIDAAALTRMRDHFRRRPAEPMGEAWFMSPPRRMFHELEGDLASLSVADLQRPLEEIASGTSSFGPMPEWNAWYHYLLCALLPRSHELYVKPLLELLITGFIALYPIGVDTVPYRGFREDALLTLGRCMMETSYWKGREIAIGTMLHRSNDNPARIWGWWDASGDFSASLFFCLKYLPDTLLRDWLHSVLAIPSPHWRAQVMAWLVGAHDILTGHVRWPSEFGRMKGPSVGWDWSHCLRPELAALDEAEAPAMLSEAARSITLEVANAYFTEDAYLEWLETISAIPYLEAEMAGIPADFEALYVHAPTGA